jgi:hypothetical protein
MDANIKAINDYFNRTPAQTKAATKIYDEWRAFYEKLESAWWISQDDYDKARNIRNAFNRANAVTAEEKEIVETVIKTGLTTEQVSNAYGALMGNKPVGDVGARRTTSTGDYLTAEEIEPEPFFPMRVKIAAGVAGVLALAAYLGTKHPIFAIPLAIIKAPFKILKGGKK